MRPGTPGRSPLIAGNWKMHKTLRESIEFVEAIKARMDGLSGREVVLCPPFTVLAVVGQLLKGTRLGLGAQDVHWEEHGAFTGEVSPPMLVDAGCRYAIIGHSERRQFFGETDESVNRKARAALAAGLSPIVCVGESLEQRERGETPAVLEWQVRSGMAGLLNEGGSPAGSGTGSPTESGTGPVVVAYEPVWAIGTGRTATPDQAQEAHRHLRTLLSGMFGAEAAGRIRILYGGSVKPDNMAALMAQPDVDGGLVGGASLEVDSFERIVKYG